MVRLICKIVGEVGSVFFVEINEDQWICELKDAIKAKKPDTIKCEADKLQLFLAKKDGAWLESVTDDVGKLKEGKKTAVIEALTHEARQLQGEVDLQEVLMGMPPPVAKQVHVLVVVPTPKDKMTLDEIKQSNEKCIWLGKHHGSREGDEGISLRDEKTLFRNAVTGELIRRFELKNVVLVKSPPMTGKTSMAALMCHALVEKHNKEMEPAIIFNFSVLKIAEMETNFAEAFEKLFKVSWWDTTIEIPHKRIVYLIVDEAQMIYLLPNSSSPRLKSSAFWNVVKDVLSDDPSDKVVRIKILIFTAYGSNQEYTKFSTPLSFRDPETLFGIQDLNFRDEEVMEYVKKWFTGVECLENTEIHGYPAIEIFCAHLKHLTGCHVGLCVTAIKSLNEMCSSLVRSCSPAMTANEMICKLQDDSIFDALISSRAIRTMKTLSDAQLDCLERVFYGFPVCSPDGTVAYDDALSDCVHKGILIENNEGKFMFASPVMERFFIKKRIGYIKRADFYPSGLYEFVFRVVDAIDYGNINHTHSKSAGSNIPLERAWQVEFYKAVCCCTPSAVKTSADVGGLFGSPGFIDFTIHLEGENRPLWGFELLREGDRLSEHIGRFGIGGRYAPLNLADFCLIDFRRMDITTQEKINADLALSEKLFIVCYDMTFTNVSLFNLRMSERIIRPRTQIVE